jgi:hypothetical protein
MKFTLALIGATAAIKMKLTTQAASQADALSAATT